MADDNYELGSMDITEHKRTWGAFMKLTTYGSFAIMVFVMALLVIYS